MPDGAWWSLENGAVTHNSHPADMWRYAAVVEDKMVAERPKPVKPPTPRKRFDARRGAKGTGLGWMR